MTRQVFDPADARRLLNPGPIGILTATWRGEPNATPIAWMSSLSMEPPLVGCAIHSSRHISDVLRFGEEFAINIPGPSLMKQTAFLGSLSGRDVNKLEAAQLDTFPGLRVEAPLIEGCLAWIECSVEDVIRPGDHTLYVGRVHKVQALEEAYASFWKLEDPEFSPLTYLGSDRYATVTDHRQATFEVDEHGALVVETIEEREKREEQEAVEEDREKLEGVEGVEEMQQAPKDEMRRKFF